MNPLHIRLAHTYATLLRGMMFPGSEGDSPYTPAYATCDPREPFNDDTFREAFNLAPWWRIRSESATTWFTRIIDAWIDDPGVDPDEITVYSTFHELLKANHAGNPMHFIVTAEVGRFHATRHYFVGRTPRRDAIAGVVTFSIET